jgi:starch synthase
MKVLLAASEVVGFAKTGGLADVVGALPRALADRGHECAVILPLYRTAATGPVALTRTDATFTVPIAGRPMPGRLWQATLPGSSVPAYLVEQPEYFERDEPAHKRGLYQYTASDGQKRDYPDNCERFVFFSRAVLAAPAALGWWPDVLHNNDWQTGLVPVYLHEEARRSSPPEQRRYYDRLRTVFTIHNMRYQGVFRSQAFPLTGLDWKLFNFLQLEFYDHLNFLKAGIMFSDIITTVSPRYAQEIQTSDPECGGCLLEGILSERRDRLVGILNGVDYATWNPATDKAIEARYTPETIDQGKPMCKAALQREFDLPESPATPLLGVVARLVEQKGVDLLSQAADLILQHDAQLVILGEGDRAYHWRFQDLRRRYPQQFGIAIGQNEALAHKIEAGADMFLMPSLFEPCGLNQMYSLKYGTVPIVRFVGGLADSVTDTTPETLAAGTATGFVFEEYSPQAFWEAVRRALNMYRGDAAAWRRLRLNGMRQDFSWGRSAAQYEQLYERLMDRKAEAR